MKKLLFILAIVLIGCTNDDDNYQKKCGKIQQKGRKYSQEGYIYSFMVNNEIFVVDEKTFNTYKNNDEYCR